MTTHPSKHIKVQKNAYLSGHKHTGRLCVFRSCFRTLAVIIVTFSFYTPLFPKVLPLTKGSMDTALTTPSDRPTNPRTFCSSAPTQRSTNTALTPRSHTCRKALRLQRGPGVDNQLVSTGDKLHGCLRMVVERRRQGRIPRVHTA